jgi:hypothetical protein
VDSYLEYHVLRLAIADESIHALPRWLSIAKLVLTAYHRTWDVFSTNQAVSDFASPSILTSSIVQLTLPELWFLHDVLEQGVIVSGKDASSFTNDNG